MKKIMMSILSLILVTQPCLAGTERGGGDQCKNEIDKDRVAIQNWILSDDAKDLDFSKALVTGRTYNDPAPAKSYKTSMLSVLQQGKVVVTCYLDPSRISDPAAQKIVQAEGVSYKTITIGSPPEPTTCINYEDNTGISHIDCNYDLIMASAGNPDYVLTHHEYASIAGVEKRTNSYVSDFSISNQLSEFEHWQPVKLLGPKTAENPTDDTTPLWNLPAGSKISLPLNLTFPAGETEVNLGSTLVGEHTIQCAMFAASSSDQDRVLNGQFQFVSASPVLREGIFGNDDTDLAADSTGYQLNGKSIGIDHFICAADQGGQYFGVYISEFRQYLEQLGGALIVQQPVPFGQ